MYNQSEFLDASGNLDREAVQAHFSRVGKLDGLQKGDVVYVSFYEQWAEATLVRRIPGDCWIARLKVPYRGMHKIGVMSHNFGGKVAQ
jgi:hypothetical protein